MKIQLASDLHLEARVFFSKAQTEPEMALVDQGADVFVLAGDIMPGLEGVSFANRLHRAYGKPVIYVLGNHEFYGHEVATLRRAIAQAAEPGVHVLDQGDVTIDGVRFLGCTLWTDFQLFGTPESSMAEAQQWLADFRYIRCGTKRMSAADQIALHQADLAWLEEKLRTPHEKTVVITHHAPCRQSIAAQFADDSCTPAFVSDLAHLMGPAVKLWCHGHTHTAFHYLERGTQVLCNPHGYPSEVAGGVPLSGYREFVFDLG